MSWHAVAALTMAGLALVCIAIIYRAGGRHRNPTLIKNRAINQHRVTPDIRVRK